MEYDESTYSWVLHNPIIVNTGIINGGISTTALPYLDGAKTEYFSISSIHIIAYAPVDDFFSRFYGSALLKFYIQREMRSLSISDNTSFSVDTIENLKNKKNEIVEKYGLVPSEETVEPEPTHIKTNRILH